MTPRQRAVQALQPAKNIEEAVDLVEAQIKKAESAAYERAAKVVGALSPFDLSIAAPSFQEVYKAIAAKIRALANDENKS
jgi:hypothetical protein